MDKNSLEKDDARMKKTNIVPVILCILLGCACIFYQLGKQRRGAESAASPLGAATGSEATLKSQGKEAAIWESEHGSLLIGSEFSIPEAAEQVVFSYMECYYETAAALKMVEPDNLFDDSENGSLALNRSAWEYMIGLRGAQHTDLSLVGYRYELSVDDAKKQRDGSFFLKLTENCVQQFAEYPDVDSEFYNIHHVFVLVQREGNWKIREHVQSDGIYQSLLGKYWDDDLALLLAKCKKIPEAAEFYSSQKKDLLKFSIEQLRIRENSHGSLELPEVQHEYDRFAAVSYADKWVGKRNKIWNDFTGQGGNCQNYVSQCLYAGGIPRDISGGDFWSYNRLDSSLPEDKECSLSWINVEVFRQYAAANRGYGLAALPDAPYLEGEIGDVIQMGFPDRWSHTVLITSVITDEQGNTVDYLIHSNTADLKNFPVSAYSLPCQTLTKILGWNG